MSDIVVTPPPELPSLPKETASLAPYLRLLSQYISGELRKRPTTGTAQGTLFLLSPDGTTYSVSVDNAGVLSTTAVAPGGGL
jgi:hypothetical protein